MHWKVRRVPTGALAILVSWAAALPAVAAPLVGIGIDGTGELYDVDTASGSLRNPRPTGVPRFSGIAYLPGNGLFGVSNASVENGASANVLLRIDLATGATTVVGPLGIRVQEGDVTYEPATGSILGVNAGGELYRIDPATGAATVIGMVPAPPSLQELSGLAFDAAGTLYALDVGHSGGTVSRGERDRLLTLDPTTGEVLREVPLGGPGLGFGAGLAFDPDTGTLFVAEGQGMNSPLNRAPGLYTIDPTTGQLNVVGAMEWRYGVSGIAFVPEPSQACLALLVTSLALTRRAGRKR
jgi:hypothetical protein